MKCRICGNTKSNSPYKVREMMFGLGESFEYFQCSQCECLQILDFPDDMSRYYPPGYYSFSEAIVSERRVSFHSLLQSRIKEERDRYVASRRGVLGRCIYPFTPPATLEFQCLGIIKADLDSRILDVGCGSGMFLRRLHRMGFRNLQGIDPFIEQHRHYDGVEISKCSIEDISGTWDIILFQHSFEHMENPAQVLKELRRCLSNSGVAVIRIPTVPCYAWQEYGIHWYQIDAPRHFLFIQ